MFFRKTAFIAYSVFLLAAAGCSGGGGSNSVEQSGPPPVDDEVAAIFDTQAHLDMKLPVPLRVDNSSSATARYDEPVTSGVPLPVTAAVTNPDDLALFDASGRPVPAQFRVMSRWGGQADNAELPIRWVLVDFQANAPSGSVATYYLDKSERAGTVQESIAIQDSADTLLVDTGAAVFEINRNLFNLFERVRVADSTSANGMRLLVDQNSQGGVVLTDGAGRRFNSLGQPEEIVVEEEGALRTVIKVRGTLQAESGEFFAPSINNDPRWPRFSQPYPNSFVYYNCRIHFYAGKDYVRVFFTLENNGANGRTNPEQYFAPVQMVYFDSVNVEINLADFKASQLLAGNGLISLQKDEEFSLFQGWREAATPSRSGLLEPSFANGPFYFASKDNVNLEQGSLYPGWLQIEGPGASISLGIRHFWQNFPKALTATTKRLEIGLWPSAGYYPHCNSTLFPETKFASYCQAAGQDAGLYLFDAGRHKTYEMFLGFHGAGNGSSTADLTRALQTPLSALAPATWFAGSKALGLIAPAGLDAENLEIDEALKDFDSLQIALIDADVSENRFTINNLKTITPAYWGASRQDRFFGWMHFGELLWSGQAPSSLHYDWPYSMLLHYLRTGQRDFLDAGVEMTRHRYDIDQYHGNRRDSEGNHVYTNYMAFYESDGHADPSIVEYAPAKVSMNSHTWNGGLVLYYLLTGDRKAWEAAVENGQAALNRFAKRADTVGCADSETRQETWPILNLLNLYRVNGDPEYLRVAKNIAVNRMLYREQQAGGIGHFGRGNGCASIDVNQQESTMYAYAIDPMIQIHYETQDQELANLLVRMADFTKNSLLFGGDFNAQGDYRPLQGNYIWTNLTPEEAAAKGGEPIKNVFWADLFAYAYRLTGDTQYLDYARQSFRDGIFYYTAPGSQFISPAYRSKISFIDTMFSGSETKAHGWIGRTNQIYLNTEYLLQNVDKGNN